LKGRRIGSRAQHTAVSQLRASLDHLLLLIFPTVVLAMAPEFGMTYGEGKVDDPVQIMVTIKAPVK